MIFLEQTIPGVFVIEPRVFDDPRGYFFESYREDLLAAKIRPIRFVQDNESRSVRGVLRGLHYQLPPFAQSKLVRVVQGAVLDVAVDIRRDAPTFGQHVAVELSAENHRQIFIPRGFAHGFVVLSETAVFSYKVDNYYSKACDRSIRWDDPSLGIDWRLTADELLLSEKDLKASPLAVADVFTNEDHYA